MSLIEDAVTPAPTPSQTPVLEARRLVKTFGRVVGLDGVSLQLHAGEVLAIIGDNGAGKSTLVKCLTGAYIPDEGTLLLDGEEVHFKRPQDARAAGIETVYQNLAVSPALDVAANLFLGRERRKPGIAGSVFRALDRSGMRQEARDQVQKLGISTLQDVSVAVENLSGGQRQAVAVARAAAFGSKVVVLDEPTAALGVRESNQVLELISRLREQGVPVILISHNMPHVFQVADRIHIQRLGKAGGDHHPAVPQHDRRGRHHDRRGTGMTASQEGGAAAESVVLYAEFTARADSVAVVAELITGYAESVRAEPGNVRFDIYRRQEEPTRFFVFEIYRDRAAFEAHLGAESGRAFNEVLVEHIEGAGSDLHFLTPVTR